MMLAAPAIAAAPDAACKEPTSPAMPNGKTAPAKDVIAAANAVKAYVAASDAYQECLKEAVEKMETDAKTNKVEVDAKLKSNLEAKGDANQAKKEQLGAAYAATAAAYRTAHPK
jgi:hypothetical protein